MLTAEVRAKGVSYSDAVHFIRSAANADFPHAMIVGLRSVSDDVIEMSGRLSGEGVFVTVYSDFARLLADALTWSRRPLPELLEELPPYVVDRLRQLEVKTSSLALWGELVASGEPAD